jgi:hypothetical protein
VTRIPAITFAKAPSRIARRLGALPRTRDVCSSTRHACETWYIPKYTLRIGARQSRKCESGYASASPVVHESPLIGCNVARFEDSSVEFGRLPNCQDNGSASDVWMPLSSFSKM